MHLARYKNVEIAAGQASVYKDTLNVEAFMKAIKDSKYFNAVRSGGAGLLIFFAVKGTVYMLFILIGYFFIS